MARRRTSNARDYPRTARLNELLREIIGDAIERIDDDRLGFVSVTGVDVDTELTFAKVYISTLDEHPEEVMEVLGEHRGELKKAISTQARIRRTPDLVFHPDRAVTDGDRIEEILRRIEQPSAGGDPGDSPSGTEA
jgi:ribosome-binding factor A